MRNYFLLAIGALLLLFNGDPLQVSLPLSQKNLQAQDVLVVRAHYYDHAMVNSLASRVEPWEVNRSDGYVVVGVNQAEYQRLIREGFRVEIDWALTEQYSRPPAALPGQAAGIPGYPCYRTLAETYSAAESLRNSHPQLASWIDIGDSWEKTYAAAGSDLYVLKITNSNITIPKPKLFVLASIHAREYAPAELLIRFAEKLLLDYGSDADITWLLDFQEIHLLLQANPDGRRIAERFDLGTQFWRKNTNQTACPTDPYSQGVDLNRNFNFEWGCCGGSSTYGCDDTYRGTGASSEPETQAVQDYVRSLFPDQRGPALNDPASLESSGVFLDIHSYGRLVLWPWGFTTQESPNFSSLRTLGKRLAYFNQYEPSQAYELYITDGTTEDFAYGELGLASYTFEVGNSFFENCSQFEEILLPKNLEALTYAARIARKPYLLPSGPDVVDPKLDSIAVLQGSPVQIQAVIDDTRFFNGIVQPIEIEPTQNIQAAQLTIDSPPWITSTLTVPIPLAPVDGLFDEPEEQVYATIETYEIEKGAHTLFIHSQDSSGNWGPVSAIRLYVADTLVFLPTILK